MSPAQSLCLTFAICSLIGAGVVLAVSIGDGDESRRDGYRVTFGALFLLAAGCVGLLWSRAI